MRFAKLRREVPPCSWLLDAVHFLPQVVHQALHIGEMAAHPFFAAQTRLTFARCGVVDPRSAEAEATETAEATLAAPGMVFVRRLRCPNCRTMQRIHCRLARATAPRVCRACDVPMRAAGVDTDTELSVRNASSAVLREPLARRGFVAGDVIALNSNGATRHFQLA